MTWQICVDVWIACSLLEHPIPTRRGKWMMDNLLHHVKFKCMNFIYCNLTSMDCYDLPLAYTYTKTSTVWIYGCFSLPCSTGASKVPLHRLLHLSKSWCQLSQQRLQRLLHSDSCRSRSTQGVEGSRVILQQFPIWYFSVADSKRWDVQRCTANINYSITVSPHPPCRIHSAAWVLSFGGGLSFFPQNIGLASHLVWTKGLMDIRARCLLGTSDLSVLICKYTRTAKQNIPNIWNMECGKQELIQTLSEFDFTSSPQSNDPATAVPRSCSFNQELSTNNFW